ncbi:MAG: major capsid protein, partial [Clostridia bacterium]|nr:major capsid protein [Clostridia bacterium]
MPNEVNIYTPRHMAAVVRQAPPVHTFFLDTFFTDIRTFPTEAVDIDLVKGDRRMAPFVHPRLGGQVMEAEGYETRTYKPPLVNPADITTADKLLTRLPGEELYSDLTPADRAAALLVQEYNRLNDYATRREEWMAVQAIVTGRIPVKGPGIDDLIDFRLENKVTLTGTARWGQSGAKPLDNLDSWVDQVQESGFSNCDMAIMGKEAMRLFLADTEVQKRLDNRRLVLGEINPRTLPSGVRCYGEITDPNLTLYTYTERYLDTWTDPQKPTHRRMVPDNAVVLISSAANFVRAYGLCTYLDDETGQWVTAQTPRLLRSYIEHRPDRRMMELQARPLPIPTKVDSW